jgi:hypothetical protein
MAGVGGELGGVGRRLGIDARLQVGGAVVRVDEAVEQAAQAQAECEVVADRVGAQARRSFRNATVSAKAA